MTIGWLTDAEMATLPVEASSRLRETARVAGVMAGETRGWVAAGALRMPKPPADCNNRANRAEKRRAARQEPEPDRPHRPRGTKKLTNPL